MTLLAYVVLAAVIFSTLTLCWGCLLAEARSRRAQRRHARHTAQPRVRASF